MDKCNQTEEIIVIMFDRVDGIINRLNHEKKNVVESLASFDLKALL